jgi:hypothetical protein
MVVPLASFMVMVQMAAAATITAIPTNFGNGADTFIHRNNTTDYTADENLAIKIRRDTEAGDGTDRLTLTKFDLSGLTGPISDASLTLTMRGSTANINFGDGNVIQMYGVPETISGVEDFTGGVGGITFANSGFTTGGGGGHPSPLSDTNNNGVDDTLLTLLAELTLVGATTQNQVLTFQSPALVSFLQADTNDLATFVFTMLPLTVNTPLPKRSYHWKFYC